MNSVAVAVVVDFRFSTFSVYSVNNRILIWYLLTLVGAVISNENQK